MKVVFTQIQWDFYWTLESLLHLLGIRMTSSSSTVSGWGTPLQSQAKRLLLLGSGELGREVALEAMRLGIEVIAVDAYAHAPAMQIAHRAHVINMLDGEQLRELILSEKPDLIVPEVEAIATATLVELEAEGWTVIPTARATQLTMNREGIRRLAAEELGLKTSPYQFAETETEYQAAIVALGLPCVVKPIMSASGTVILATEQGDDPQYSGMAQALTVPSSKLRLFGKPTCRPSRRMGVALALGDTIEEARKRAKDCAARITVRSCLDPG
jgi:formate-dependent phosphoribosylglycinamide formyltransferase (GAR transformylase)